MTRSLHIAERHILGRTRGRAPLCAARQHSPLAVSALDSAR